jgi:beta-lactamase regulating signal transducer with metallopeptidase domain
MHEQIARTLCYLGIHLMFASMVWLAAWVLTSIPRGSATTKYWIWVPTSLNFILPSDAILEKMFTMHLSWATPLGIIGGAANAIVQDTMVAAVIFAVWLLGAAVMFTRLCLRIRAERSDSQALSRRGPSGETPVFLAQGIPVKYSATWRLPRVEGVLRPHVSLPNGIDRVLSERELQAVLITR